MTRYEVRGLWKDTVLVDAASPEDASHQYHAVYPGAVGTVLSVRAIADPTPDKETTAP